MNRRRLLLAGAAGVLTPVSRALGQQPARKFRIAALFSIAPAYNAPYRAALMEQLAVRGFVEGQNLAIASSGTERGFERLKLQVAELLKAKPDAVFTTTTRFTQAALSETHSVPIVFVWVPDPVASGLVKNYARPGGNATGVSTRFYEVAIKRLEMLRELRPNAKQVLLAGPMYLPEIEAAVPGLRTVAHRLGFKPTAVDTGEQYPLAYLDRAIKDSSQALLPLFDYSSHGQGITGEQLVGLIVKRRVAAIFAESELVDAGGLMSFGSNLLEDVRRGADMLAQVLRGAKPGELPIDQASRFELVINLKTARTMGIVVPPSLLLRADRVIE